MQTPQIVSWLRSSSPPLPTLTTTVRHLRAKVPLPFARHFSYYICHTSHCTSMTGNGTKNETLITGQGPLSESSSQMGMKCHEAVLEFRKGRCTAMDKVRAIRNITDILSSASPPLTSSELNNLLETYLQILSSMSDLSLQLDPAIQNNWRLQMLQGPGKSELSPQLSILKFLKGRRLTKRTSCGPSERCSPAQCSWMNCRRPSIFCRPTMTTEKSELLVAFSSNLARQRLPSMSRLWTIGSSHGTSIPRLSLLLSHTGLASYPCTHSKFSGLFLPPILEATQVSSTSTRQSRSVLGNVKTHCSWTMPSSKIYGCIGSIPSVPEILVKLRLNQISEVRTHATSGIEGFASQRHLIVSTSTSAKSVAESTGPANVRPGVHGPLSTLAIWRANCIGMQCLPLRP